MKKVGMTLITAVFAFFLCYVISEATELKLYQLKEKTDVKEQMNDDSATVVSLEEGTPVLFLEENQGWIKIRYQNYEGYVSSETSLASVVAEEEMKEGFGIVEREFDNLYQGISIQQRKDRQGILWRIVILILIAVIIGSYVALGIIKQLEKKKRKEHKEGREEKE